MLAACVEPKNSNCPFLESLVLSVVFLRNGGLYFKAFGGDGGNKGFSGSGTIGEIGDSGDNLDGDSGDVPYGEVVYGEAPYGDPPYLGLDIDLGDDTDNADGLGDTPYDLGDTPYNMGDLLGLYAVLEGLAADLVLGYDEVILVEPDRDESIDDLADVAKPDLGDILLGDF